MDFIQIQRHSSELHSISDSKSTYIPLSCHQNAIPSDWAHFHRADSTYSAHVPLQISSKSNAIRPSYTRFPTQRALIYLWVATKTRSPSDLAHFYRDKSAHTRHASLQISSKSNDTRPSYKRFPTQRAIIHIWTSGRLKEHLYTFESLPKRDPPPIELIFTG